MSPRAEPVFDGLRMARIMALRGMGLDQRRIAARLDLSQQTVSRYLRAASAATEDLVRTTRGGA